MSDFAASLIRDFVQKLLGMIFAWVGVHYVAIPPDVKKAVTNWAVLAVTAGALLLWTALVRWLETAQGASQQAVYRRALGRALMLGVKTTPAYTPPPPPVPAPPAAVQ